MGWRVTVSLVLVVAACRGGSQQSNGQVSQAAPPPESEPPVALNPDVPIAYPPVLYEQKVEGDVTLRLFVDSTGKLIPESTRVAEPSGYASASRNFSPPTVRPQAYNARLARHTRGLRLAVGDRR